MIPFITFLSRVPLTGCYSKVKHLFTLGYLNLLDLR